MQCGGGGNAAGTSVVGKTKKESRSRMPRGGPAGGQRKAASVQPGVMGRHVGGWHAGHMTQTCDPKRSMRAGGGRRRSHPKQTLAGPGGRLG